MQRSPLATATRPMLRSALHPIGFVALCQPSSAPKPPTGDGWLHEIKHDGFRLLAWRAGDRISEGLASALATIDAAAHEIENVPAEQNPATAHLFIINPLSGKGMDKLFSTHPSTANRIAALEQLATQMGVASSERRPRPA